MKRILVIGPPGAGKSHLSRQLSEITGLPLYHMDRLFWNADKTHATREELTEKLLPILPREGWIIDGNYTGTLALRLNAADTVLYLDYPVQVCLDGVRARRGTVRPDLPWIEEEEDPEFTEYIMRFPEEQTPAIKALLAQAKHITLHRFAARAEAERFLAQLKK